jgi:biopolymer transport protein ExbB
MRLFALPLTLTLAALVTPLGAQSSDPAAAAEARLQASLRELAALRETIRQEKVPLSRQLQQLQSEVDTLRREADRTQRLADNGRLSLENAREDVKRRREEVDYVQNLVAEYTRSLEARADLAELPFLSGVIQDVLTSAEEIGLDPAVRMQRHVALLDAAVARAGNLVGGQLLEGSAVGPGGTMQRGKFALFGPVTFFAASDGSSAGLSSRTQSLRPAVVPVPGNHDAAIRALVGGSAATVPLDPTLGNAMAIASTRESLGEHLAKGGIWIIPIVSFGLLAMVVALFKAYEILTLPRPPAGTTQRLLLTLRDQGKGAAEAMAKKIPGPIGKMLAEGVRYSDEPPELIEEIQFEVIMETQPKVMRLLPLVSVTAAVAPLLGLLGTVTGMISTFKMIQIFGTGDARQLSSGISEALITTEWGLIVAIPSLLLYALLSRRAKAYLAEMEKTAVSFLNGLKALGLGAGSGESESEPAAAKATSAPAAAKVAA